MRKETDMDGVKAIAKSAPYNGEPEYNMNTEKAQELGFEFSTLQDWIYELIDYYIQLIN